MKNLKITLSTIVATLAICFSINMLNAEHVEARSISGYEITFKECLRGPNVIRCANGPGSCEAEDQWFCDELQQQ
ncbi:MAG: hypothetical protein ABJ043_12225 [Balneola sp.]